MSARTLLIIAGSLFLTIIALLAAYIIDDLSYRETTAAELAEANLYHDHVNKAARLLYDARLLGVVALAPNGDMAAFEAKSKEFITSTDQLASPQMMPHHLTINEVFQGAISDLKEAMAEYTALEAKVLKREASFTEWLETVNMIRLHFDQLAAAVFSTENAEMEGIYQNTVMKPMVQRLNMYTSLEQAYLADLITANAGLSEERKATLSLMRHQYMDTLHNLKDFMERMGMSDEQKVALAEMVAALDSLENQKKRIYAYLMLGFGDQPTISTLSVTIDEVNDKVMKVNESISNPLVTRMAAVRKQQQETLYIMITAAIIGLLFLVGLSLLIHRKILLPLARQKVLQREFEENVQSVIQSVSEQVVSISKAAETMRGASDKALMEAMNVRDSLMQADSSVQNVASSIHEMNASIHGISKEMSHVSDTIGSTKNHSDQTQKVMAILLGASQRIGSTIDIIKEIAEQTNLLALNASIEAARAGDAGRGFAVVADEVKKLSTETASATKTVTDLVSEIQANCTKTNTAIKQISGQIEEIDQVGGSIRTALGEQSLASQSISDNATQTSEISDRVKTTVDEMMQALEEAGNYTTKLTDGVQVMSSAVDNLAKTSNKFLAEIRRL